MSDNNIKNVVDFREVNQIQKGAISKAEKVIATRKEGIV